ncbi:MAG: right-handed parallel beta-helix repeat-containing protein, partial [Candidatus Thorarchaeota archaeon]
DAINITSNDGFVSGGWAGQGTSENPYLIEFFEFTDPNGVDGPCISISDTTVHFKITNCSFNTTVFASAFALDNVTNGQIQYCSTENFIWGMRVDNCSGIQLDHLIGSSCIVIEDSSNCNISHCTINYAPGDGIYLYNCSNITATGCDISLCAANGIWLEDTMNSTIIGNKLILNSLFQIDVTGVSEDNVIYNNVIEYNFMDSFGGGRDNGATNFWDDNVSTGNWWSDYDESGSYDISGTAGSVDHYPMGHNSVLLVNHGDVICNIRPNVSIMWDAFSEVPDHYIIYRNGEVDESKAWDGLDISTNVITDTIGIFNYTVFVNGTSGNNKTDTVMVTLYDNVPTLDSPDDISYVYGETGNFINWNPSDINPNRYEIYRGSSLVFSDNWDGSQVSHSVSGLSVGTYEFKLCVFDTSENNASDTVQVTVTPSTTTPSEVTNTTTTTATSETTTTGFQLGGDIILIVGIGGAILLITIVIVKLKR